MKRISIKIGCVIFAIITLVCPSVHFAQDYKDTTSCDYSYVNSDSASVAIGGFIGQLMSKEHSYGLLIDDSVAVDKDELIKGFESGLAYNDPSLESYKIGVFIGYQMDQLLSRLEEDKGLKIDRKKLFESFRKNVKVYSDEKAFEYQEYIQTHFPDLFGGAAYSDSVCVDTVCVDMEYYEVDSVVIGDCYFMDSAAVEDSIVMVEKN